MAPVKPGPSLVAKLAYVIGLIMFGCLNTITMKIAFTMKSVGSMDEEKTFQKPWCITFTMFVAMSLALVYDKDMRRRCCGKSSNSGLQAGLLIDEAPADGGTDSQIPWGKKVVMVAPAAVFDIAATALCSTGFLYIPASVWQLLRGAEMVFAKIFAVIFLKQESYVFSWVGVFLCSVGIVVVGLASVWGESYQVHSAAAASQGSSFALVVLGIGLCLLGQVVQAAQVIAEEHLLKECDLPGMQIVGFEGIWGGLIMVPIIVALYFMPGDDNGRFEDEVDTVAMLQANPHLAYLMMLYLFSCSTYNMAGIAVTGALTAVHRVMLEALRTSVVWAFGLAVHSWDPKSPFGEAWTPYSPLEVFGFAMIVFGQAVYGAMIKLPGLSYPPDLEDVQAMPSPGGMRNLTAAIQVSSPSRGLSGKDFASPGGQGGKSAEKPIDSAVDMTIQAT